MPVGDFARSVAAAAETRGVRLEVGPTFQWLSGLGHLEPEAQDAPASLLKRLKAVHEALGGDAAALAAKRPRRPSVDFVRGSVIIEIDEFQHFSSARLKTLDFYGGVETAWGQAEYQALCEAHHRRADRYRWKKPTKDFPFEGGRTKQRAFLDTVRDFLGPHFGYTVLRIPAPENDLKDAVSRLLDGLGEEH